MQDLEKKDGQLFATPYSSLPNKRVVEINVLVWKKMMKNDDSVSAFTSKDCILAYFGRPE